MLTCGGFHFHENAPQAHLAVAPVSQRGGSLLRNYAVLLVPSLGKQYTETCFILTR